MKNKQILEMLSNSEEDIRQSAIVELFKSNDINAIPLLKKTAIEDPSLKLRHYAKKALQILKENTIAEELQIENYSKSENDSKNQSQLLSEKKAEIHNKLKKLIESENSDNRHKAIQAIVKLNDPIYKTILHQALKIETNPKIKIAILSAFEICGQPEDTEHLLKELENKDLKIRVTAIKTISALNPSSLKYIIKQINTKNEQLKTFILNILKTENKLKLLKLLKDMTESDDPAERELPLNCSKILNENEQAILFTKLLHDNNASIRELAMKKMNLIAEKGNNIACHVIKYKNDKNIFAYADEAFLSLFVEYSSDEALIKELNDPEKAIRLKAVKEIEEENPKGAICALISRLEIESDPFVISNILLCLSRAGNMDLLPNIIKFSTHSDSRVRASAIEALGNFDNESIYLKIFPYLHDENNRVKANAIMALSNYPYFNYIFPIKMMLKSNNDLMKKSALYAISDIGSTKFIPILKNFLKIEKKRDIKDSAIDTLKILDTNWSSISNTEKERKKTLKENNKKLFVSNSENININKGPKSIKKSSQKPLFLGLFASCILIFFIFTYFSKGIKNKNEILESKFNKAMVILHKNPSQALKLFRECTLKAPDNLKYRLSNAKLLLNLNQESSGIFELEKLLSIAPGHEEAGIKLAECYQKNKDTDKAIKILNKLSSANTESWLAHFRLGTIYYSLNDIDNAIAEFFQVITIKKDFPKVYYNLGVIYFEKELYDKAIEYLYLTLRYDNKMFMAYRTLGILFIKKQEYIKAIQYLDKAIEIEPNAWENFYYKALAYKENKSYAFSSQFFLKVLNYKKDHFETYVHLAFSYDKMEEYQSAVKYYLKAIELHPEDANIHFKIASVYHKVKKLSKALKYYKSSIKYNKDFAEAYYNIGTIYVEQKKNSMALHAFKKALILEPTNKIYNNSVKSLNPK